MSRGEHYWTAEEVLNLNGLYVRVAEVTDLGQCAGRQCKVDLTVDQIQTVNHANIFKIAWRTVWTTIDMWLEGSTMHCRIQPFGT